MSKQRGSGFRLFLGAVLASLLSLPTQAAPRLEMLWSSPITAVVQRQGLVVNPSVQERLGTGLVLVAQTAAGKGSPIFLADQLSPGRQLLITPGATSLKKSPLALKGPPTVFFSRLFDREPRHPHATTIATNASGDIWLAGYTSGRTVLNEAYAARLGKNGVPLWEKTYGRQGGYGSFFGSFFQSIAPMEGGGAVIAGKADKRGWLILVNDAGVKQWQVFLGDGKRLDVVVLTGNRIVAAGFDDSNRDGYFQDDMTIWTFNQRGKQLSKTRVNKAANGIIGTNLGELSIYAGRNSIYVQSGWGDFYSPYPVRLSKFSLDGKLSWSVPLPDTSSLNETAVRTWQQCRPALTETARANPLMACALKGQIQLYEFNPDTGTYRKATVPLPSCQADHPAALFFGRGNPDLALSGSRPPNNVGANCSWMGKLVGAGP